MQCAWTISTTVFTQSVYTCIYLVAIMLAAIYNNRARDTCGYIASSLSTYMYVLCTQAEDIATKKEPQK